MIKIVTAITGTLITAVILVALVLSGLGPVGWFLAGLCAALYGWVWFAYFHYRYLRQEELLHLLSTAADVGSPIGPALWGYVSDRSRGWGFDRELEHLAWRLEQGDSLAGALRALPGLVARETVLAAALGESSGKLAACLRSAPRWRFATVWLEALPRLLYPLVLLLFINGIFIYLMIRVAPKFEKIFADFHFRFPETTQHMLAFGRTFLALGGGLGLVLFGLALLTVLLIVSPTARWYCPGVGRLIRMHIQSRILSMLGILLETDQPLPHALNVLADSGYFTGAAQQRLVAVRQAIERGEALAPAMHGQGLLPNPMVALVQAAERTHTVPAALTALGAHLVQRAERLVRRATMIFFPAAVVVIGVLAGFVALSYFLPLIKLITELTP